MAPKKGKESPLELCSETNKLGNTICVRIIEYLSNGKTEPHNLRLLASDFLDICEAIWSIEAGLLDSPTHGHLLVELLEELGKKIRSVKDDFIALDQMLAKILDGQRKGGIRRGWRMMFADTDVDNIRRSFAKSQEALKMSSLMFRWSVGARRSDAPTGIGYTALYATLGRSLKHDKHVAINASLPSIPPTPPSSGPPTLPLPSPSGSLGAATFAPANKNLFRYQDHLSENPASTRQTMRTQPRPDSDTLPSPINQLAHHKRFPSPIGVAYPDNASETTVALTAIEGMLNNMDYEDKMSRIEEHEISDNGSHIVNLDAVRPPPGWNALHNPRGESQTTTVALRHAIQHNNHRAVEQLLTHGSPLDTGLGDENLRVAITRKDAESVRLLLQHGADSRSVDIDGFTPLHSATKLSFLRAAQLLIECGADPNFCAGDGTESPLAMAVNENMFDFVQLYLNHGGRADAEMPNGDTLLVKAINQNTSANIVESMLIHGGDANTKNGHGTSPLFAAIQAKRTDLVRILLENGANPNLPGPKHPLWPSTYQPEVLQLLLAHGADLKKCPGVMELAASLNSRASVTILLNAGADPNTRKDGIYTPLCTAIRDNRADIISLLLAKGADPNFMASEYPAFKCVTHHRTHFLPQLAAAGADLHSPKGIIEKAVAHNNKEALMWLLDQGVNPNDRSPEGKTALATAIRDEKIDFIDILLAHGASPVTRGQDWPIAIAVKHPQILAKLLSHVSNKHAIPKGVMEMAVVADQLESVKLLLKAGVSVEEKNGGVFSPLTTALREHRKEIVRFLLDEAGANPNAPGEHLPIIKAIRRCENNDYEYIEMLLDKGADVNLVYRGWNAVLQSVENGDAYLLKMLIERGGGVDLKAEDETGRTVMEIVEERGWQEAVDILHEYKGQEIERSTE
jgi:ankyrin repeat protein